jgi:hypothetical protein
LGAENEAIEPARDLPVNDPATDNPAEQKIQPASPELLVASAVAPLMPVLSVILTAGAGDNTEAPQSIISEPTLSLPHIPPPVVESEDVRMVTVLLRPTGDKLRDNLRMRQAYGALISYPGNDRFAFLVHERGRSFQIEFPNFTTGINPELLGRLQRLVGLDNVQVEDLTFH